MSFLDKVKSLVAATCFFNAQDMTCSICRCPSPRHETWCKGQAVKESLDQFEWSATPPTEEGYYWLYVPEWNLDPEIVWVFNSGGIADPCYEFNRMIDGYSNPDYVTAPVAQWMKIETQEKPKE